NGNYHVPARSWAKEYTLDETNHIVTLDWSYSRNFGAGNVFSKAMGSVQRLSNGNTFICWGLVMGQTGAPKITELDGSNNVVWEMSFPNEDAVYRSHRYLWVPCARPSDDEIYVDNITSTAAKINWTAATNATYYDLRFRKVN